MYTTRRATGTARDQPCSVASLSTFDHSLLGLHSTRFTCSVDYRTDQGARTSDREHTLVRYSPAVTALSDASR